MARSSRALVVELVADVKDFVKGTQQADTALGDFVSDTQRDLDKIERAGKDMADGVQRATKDMADGMERSFDNISREAKRSFDKVGRAASDEMSSPDVKGSFKEAGSEVGAEFAQNLGESLSSGDLTSVAKDTAGGLVSAFAAIGGPIGIALAGVATGATVLFQKMQQEAEEATARIGALFESMTEDAMAKLQETFRGQELAEAIETLGGGDPKKGWDTFRKSAEQAGKPVQTIVDDFLKGGQALTDQIASIRSIQAAGTTVHKTMQGNQVQMTQAAKAAKATADNLSKWSGEVDQAEDSSATFNATVSGTNRVTSGILTNLSGWRREVQATQEAMRGTVGQAIELDRRLSTIARNSSKTAENMRAAAGQSLGGRALL